MSEPRTAAGRALLRDTADKRLWVGPFDTVLDAILAIEAEAATPPASAEHRHQSFTERDACPECMTIMEQGKTKQYDSMEDLFADMEATPPASAERDAVVEVRRILTDNFGHYGYDPQGLAEWIVDALRAAEARDETHHWRGRDAIRDNCEVCGQLLTAPIHNRAAEARDG
jgi:hypothetical protein